MLFAAIDAASTLVGSAAMALDTLLLNPTAAALERDLLDKHYNRKHGKDAYYGQR